MTTVGGSDVSLPEPFEAEWGILRAYRHNVLLEGPCPETNEVLRLLRPHIGEPIVWNRPHAPLDLPNGETRGLILRDVTGLTAIDQKRLLAWIDSTGSLAQIVSTTERPIFGLVAQGLFDEVLYYRLNVVLIHLGSRHSRGLRAHEENGLALSGPTTVPTLQEA
jgi:Sigma-54 interaction domain